MEFLGPEIFYLGISYEASVFPALGLIVFFLALLSELLHSPMDSSPPSTESGPKPWISDHGMGDKFHDYTLLFMGKSHQRILMGKVYKLYSGSHYSLTATDLVLWVFYFLPCHRGY